MAGVADVSPALPVAGTVGSVAGEQADNIPETAAAQPKARPRHGDLAPLEIGCHTFHHRIRARADFMQAVTSGRGGKRLRVTVNRQVLLSVFQSN
jgi:hypothetical protein